MCPPYDSRWRGAPQGSRLSVLKLIGCILGERSERDQEYAKNQWKRHMPERDQEYANDQQNIIQNVIAQNLRNDT